ncbi:hypothetical protein DS837_30350 [Azospirillum brasilense]|uniref:Uncharacterized protein n=1 Tax=Azospirillum brasilense TaxID=192 RepID=A0A6L3ARS8_AZOBR|nr:hypothetical protein DS837_30350 [Azospirillum brasilense]
MSWDGERVGGFVRLTNQDGLRVAIRPGSISLVGDADPAQDSTVLVAAGRSFVLPHKLDEIIDLLGTR